MTKPDRTIESSRLFTETGRDAEDAIDALLGRWDTNAFEFFERIDVSQREKGVWPWAIALYEKEFRLAGHVVSIRQHRGDFSFSAYSMKPVSFSIEQHDVPLFSILWINNKTALDLAAKRSPLFDQAWHLLKDKDEACHWVCMPSSPSEDWVTLTSKGDDELFLSTIGMAQIQGGK